MRKLIYVIVILVFFLFGLSFFMQNAGTVTLNYYRGWQIELPLTVLMMVMMICGIVIGYFASLIKSLKLRTRLARANRQIKTLEERNRIV